MEIRRLTGSPPDLLVLSKDRTPPDGTVGLSPTTGETLKELVPMQNLHTELLSELANSQIEERVRTASRAFPAGGARTVARRRLYGGHRRPRHLFRLTAD